MRTNWYCVTTRHCILLRTLLSVQMPLILSSGWVQYRTWVVLPHCTLHISSSTIPSNLFHLLYVYQVQSDQASCKEPPDVNGKLAETKSQDAAARGRQYVLQELLKTENDYVRDLSYVVQGYLTIINDPNPPIVKPDSLSETKKRLLFANIESIFKFHKE